MAAKTGIPAQGSAIGPCGRRGPLAAAAAAAAAAEGRFGMGADRRPAAAPRLAAAQAGLWDAHEACWQLRPQYFAFPHPPQLLSFTTAPSAGELPPALPQLRQKVSWDGGKALPNR